MCLGTGNKVSIQIIYLIVKMSNSQMVSEGGGGKFIATRVPHAVCLAREEGLGVVCTVLQIRRIHVL